MPAFFRTTIGAFLSEDENAILGALISGAGEADLGDHKNAQTRSWQEQIRLLKQALTRLIDFLPVSILWGLLFEYTIPRRQRRLDTVILAGDLVLVLEFKVGAKLYDASSRRQVEDYALDLRDFHEQSRGRVIIPVLIATEAAEAINPAGKQPGELVQGVHLTNASNLPETIAEVYRSHNSPTRSAIDSSVWDASSYKPVPTIIEAAEELFAGHSVREISAAHTDVFNLTRTASKLVETVAWAQSNQRKVICFVTGVPGAGKTLAGLTVVHDPQLRSADRPAGVFLSGNSPLVKVIRAALARDNRRRTGLALSESKRRIETFVQNVHAFIREYSEKEGKLPPDRVVVFDEAQRAWDAQKQKKKFGRDASEAEVILSIMDRHDWSVIIALVGGGQEIHDGEAGLTEWGETLASKFPNWRILASPEVLSGGAALSGHKLFRDGMRESVQLNTEEALHLPVSIRSFKAENLSKWVDAVLGMEAAKAAALMRQMGDFPIVFTRSLDRARQWLRQHTRGERRCGLVASSRALRLRADGIELSSGFRGSYQYEEWFLGPVSDVRSSHQLEVAASEFECQGLELDWVGVCWGGDFVLGPNMSWQHRILRGTQWKNVRSPVDRQFILNKYRVLLTRAREGLVIWIPTGDASDPTRDPGLLDGVAAYFSACGVESVE